ncbi:MAG TPA: hypothetical protein VFR18_23795, partial [Terriglobia bacterium]|nr:hypothetical protein [Terriglobia bacterium]
GDFEIGRILHFRPENEISNWTVQSKISNFGFEMQDSSNFKTSDFRLVSISAGHHPPGEISHIL